MKKIITFVLLCSIASASFAEKIKLIVVKDFDSRVNLEYQLCMLDLNDQDCRAPITLNMGAGYRHDYSIKVDNFTYFVKLKRLSNIDSRGIVVEKEFDEYQCRGYVKDTIIAYGKTSTKSISCATSHE